MKRIIVLTTTALLVACAGMSAVEDRDLGLAKGSVFDTPAPVPYTFVGPDQARLRPAPLGTPPVITHPIDDSTTITATSNGCITCHDRPQAAGKAAAGQPTAIAADHYLRSGDGKMAVSGAYYNCLLCHAPQTADRPLVGESASR